MILRVDIEREAEYYGSDHLEKWTAYFDGEAWEFNVDVIRSGSKSLFSKSSVPHSAVPDDVREDVFSAVDEAFNTGLDREFGDAEQEEAPA